MAIVELDSVDMLVVSVVQNVDRLILVGIKHH